MEDSGEEVTLDWFFFGYWGNVKSYTSVILVGGFIQNEQNCIQEGCQELAPVIKVHVGMEYIHLGLKGVPDTYCRAQVYIIHLHGPFGGWRKKEKL